MSGRFNLRSGPLLSGNVPLRGGLPRQGRNLRARAMGRFYFHLREGDTLIPDDEGQDLPDVSVALREAMLTARDLLAEAIMAGKDEVPDAVVIGDEAGRPVETFPVAVVLPKHLKLVSGPFVPQRAESLR